MQLNQMDTKQKANFSAKANSLMPLTLITLSALIFIVAIKYGLSESAIVTNTLNTFSTGAIALSRSSKDGE